MESDLDLLLENGGAWINLQGIRTLILKCIVTVFGNFRIINVILKLNASSGIRINS